MHPASERRNEMDCVICGGVIEPKRTPDGVVYWTQGENAQPVADGRCCVTCNNEVVLPWRFVKAGRYKAALAAVRGEIKDA
jgi:hypothetical protein